ncbi:LOW QUALITY PROTEIN: hypothetical protein, conserved [Eimeria necatrix]|uniref:Anonymous antigen-1 n=1 Tax=Eimeria necatrix TaxID=51315 RepID=U6MLF7_9EIME|nr:LOW QUALITY PROTEIN: hypothetical protein, conserved [Eimeria necatrix]CDJ64851.1 hypothetical protein, conserved [Eimeria necatrix]
MGNLLERWNREVKFVLLLFSSVKRNPDAGVATAVQGIIQHQKFKRMLLFGLRSLADFCSPTNQLYQENAQDAMDKGVLPAMQTAVETFPDDEDLMNCCSRVIWAMSEACKDEMDANRIALLAAHGGPVCLAIVNSCPTDSQTVSDAMTFVENMDKAGSPLDGGTLAPGLLAIFSKKINMKTAARVAAALAVATNSPSGAQAADAAGGMGTVLDFCLANGDMSESSVQCVESVFDACKHMAEQGCAQRAVLEQCIGVMDKYRSKKGAFSKGSAALASMIGPEQLQQCLATLKSSSPGSPEHDEALTTLGSMSYISSFTDEIVRAGGIPLLCELINSGLTQIETNPDKIYKMVGGAAKMLARIASNPTNVDSMVQSGAVATLATAVSYCTDNLECLGALCMALTPLAARESLASEIVQYQTFATVLPLLYQHVENADFAPLAMELVATGSQHPELHQHMVANLAVEICAMCCSYHLKDTSFQANAILSLNRLASNLSSVHSILEYSGFQGINASIKANIQDATIVQGAIQLYEQLSKVADAKTYMASTDCVDAVLEAMLEHEQNEALVNSGVNCLSVIATESDCHRHLSDLDTAIQTAKGDPDRAYRALAAVAGLSRVSHLRQSFEARNAAEVIMKGIQNWIDGSRFEGQGRVIRAGLKTVKIIKVNGEGDLTPVLVSMCEVACLPPVKRIVELEEPDDNILVHCTAGARDVAATSRISRENIDAAVEAIMKVMRKYADSRRSQINCLEALNYLALCDSGGGVEVIVKSGALNAVVQYLNRSPMYLDAQIAGFTVLATCAKIDPSSAEVMKKCNVLSALKVAMRTHSKSKELKRTIAPLLALLMPVDALEREISERVAECKDAMEKNNMVGMHEALSELNELLVSAEGAKIAARLGVGAELERFATYAVAHKSVAMAATDYDILGNDLYVATMSEIAHAVEQMASVRTGCIHALKTGNVESVLSMYGALNATEKSSFSEEAALHCLEALRLMIKTDRKSADVAFEHNVVAILCSGIDNYQDSAPVLAATCGCLAALATTPSRVAALVAQPDFDNLVNKLVRIISEDPKRDNRLVAIKALRELVERCNDPSLAVKICDAGAVVALFSTIENYGDDEELVREAATTLALLGVHDDLRRFYGNDVRGPCMILTSAIDKQKHSDAAAYQLLSVLNIITTRDDRPILKELGAMGQVAETMRLHPDNENITRVGGELFAKMGADEQIKSLMLHIISTVESGDENMVTTVDGLCAQLAMFLAAPLDDPADALQHTEKCLTALTTVLQMAPEDQRLHGNVATVARRLCDRCFDDPNDSYGAWAVASSGLLHQLGAMIAAGQVDSNKGFLVPGYRTLAACAANPYSMPTLQEVAPSFLPQTYTLLEAHKNDAETTARILEFLRYFAEDANGAAMITQNMSGSSGDIVSLTLLLMQQHQNSDAVVTSGMYLLGALAYNGAVSGAEPIPKFADGSALRECEALCGTNASQERMVAYASLLERLILSQSYGEALAKQKALEKLVLRMQAEEESKKLSEEARANMLCSVCRVFMAAGAAAMVGEIEQSKGFDLIIQAIEDYPDNPGVIRDSCRALAAMSANDANLAARTIKEAIPLLAAGEAQATITSDAECADAYCDLLMQLCAAEGNGRQLLAIDGVEDSLNKIDALCDSGGSEDAAELKKKTAMIRQAMADDQPHEKTCKDVYDLLNNRVASSLSIAIPEVAVLQEELEFVFSRLQMYNAEKLDWRTPIGADHQYGNMALEIFASSPANYKALQQQEFVKMELSILKSVKDEEIVLYAVKALASGCKNPACAQDSARTAGCPTIVTEAVSRVNKASDMANERKEEHLCARLLLVERTAVNRNLYNKTNAVSELIRCWNDFDKGMYSTTLLRHVFRAMRRIVSDAHVDELLKANVLQRLIAIIADLNADLALLPDVLFLLGSLAVVPEIKSKIGELNGVTACFELLQRSLPNPQATAVVTNTCLAFANICIGHKKNTELFHKLGGPDLTVRVLNERCTEYDVCNAASVLLCNLLYKNEAMKQHLGTNGAPAALVKGLSNYDGSTERSAIRCLESLFKAISNLSLYTPNIQPFLDAGIENAYSAWLSNLTEEFPDAQLETGCRTLANLVMENDPNNMRKFGVCLLPCMQVASQGRQDTKALMLLLDIEASLCRLNDNAVAFADNGGIETTIRIIHQFDYDVGLLTLGIHLLSIQSTLMPSIQRMVEADVFSILVGCVEVDAEGNEVTDLVVGGLRCTRRIIRSQELAFEYCNAGGIATVANVICKSINQPMVMLEACRVLLCLLALTTRPQEERAAAVQALHDAAAKAAQEAGAVPDENGNIPDAEPDPEELANAAYGGWYHMGMDEVMIGAIIQAVCACAGSESHAKQLRLQRISLGVAAHFVSEQMGQESFVGSGGELVIMQALNTFPGEQSIAQLSCIIVNSIAMTSGDMYDSIKTRELVAAFKGSISKIGNKKPEEKAVRDECQKTLDALGSNLDPMDAFASTVTELDLNITQWNVDPYPNGVHDLPVHVKEALRKGGELKVYIGDKEAEKIRWRSSQDLNAFEWNIGNETDWNNRVPIVRIRNVAKGLSHPALVKANKKSRSVTSKICLCIFGPPNEDNPAGIELPLRAKSQKERDHLVEMLVQWRDAATYNF